MKLFQKLINLLKQFKSTQTKYHLNGKEINLTGDNTTIKSTNFSVDKNGNMNCNNAKMIGGSLELGGSSSNSNLILQGPENDWGNFKTSIFPAGLNVLQNNYWQLIGLQIIKGSGPSIGTHIMGEIQLNDQNYTSQTAINALGIITPKVTQTSKEENKKNFEKLQNGLDIIKETDIYKYNLKSESDIAKKHIGFVIGDNYNYSKEITSENNDGVDTYSMISVAYKAIQEQQELIEQLQNEIKELKGEK